MSEAHHKEIAGLLKGRRSGDEFVERLERAVRVADAHNDVPLGFDLRIELLKAASNAGLYDRMVVAFTWCLAQFDRNRDLLAHQEWNLLWYYKWVASTIPCFHQVSREQIAQTFADMHRRYGEAGFSPRSIYSLEATGALRTGDLALVPDLFARFKSAPRDHASDCAACEADRQVGLLLAMGDDKRAIATAKPVLAGRLSCKDVPAITFSRLLLPLARAGRADEAQALHRQVIRQVRTTRHFVEQIGDHVRFLAITAQHTAALRLAETGLKHALELRLLSDRFAFFLAARLLFKRLADAGRATVKLRLPTAFPGHRPDLTYAPADLAGWFAAEARVLADRFNRRNGNAHYTTLIARNEELAALTIDLPADDAGG